HPLERKTLGAQIARLQNLLEKIGANQALQGLFLIDLGLRPFHALSDPAAAFRLGKMHEFGADGAAIDAAGFYGGFAGEAFEVGLLEGAEKAERVEIGFEVAPAAEGV